MTDLPTIPADALQATVSTVPERPGTAFVVDCDRTLTGDDLIPDARALDSIMALRQARITCILATGRTKEELVPYPRLQEAFEAFVLEGGASWGPWDDQWQAGNANLAQDAAARVEAQGIAVTRGKSSFSCDGKDLERVKAIAADCQFFPNVDRVDVLPPGLDKGIGLDGALARMGRRGMQVIAIGDGENDLPLFARAQVRIAPANAHASVKEAADVVLDVPGPLAVVQAAQRILQGEWALHPKGGAV